jgi:hypothetical protein
MSTNDAKRENRKRFFSMFVLPVVIVLATGLIVMVVIQGLTPPASSIQDGSIEFVQVTEAFTPGNDVAITVDTVTVYVPKNATEEPGNIFIALREPDLFPIGSELGWARPQIVNVEYRNSEGFPYTGITFSSAIEICFMVTEEQWQDYMRRPDEYQVQYYAEQGDPPRWEQLAMKTHADRFQICGLTDHLSLFALAIKIQVTIPQTGATPTPGLYAP